MEVLCTSVTHLKIAHELPSVLVFLLYFSSYLFVTTMVMIDLTQIIIIVSGDSNNVSSLKHRVPVRVQVCGNP